MSHHKRPRLNPQNWDILQEDDLGLAQRFEKIRKARPVGDPKEGDKPRGRQHFHRQRFF